MPQLVLSLFGSFDVQLDGRRVTEFRSDKARALLAYLVVESDRPHTRSKLAGLLWPDYPEASALTYLRHALANLRKILANDGEKSPFLLVEGDGLQFDFVNRCQCDFTELGYALAQVTIDSSPSDPSVLALLRVQTCYRAPFLDGFALAENDRFEEWLLLTRERLHRQLLVGLEICVDHLLAAAKRTEAIALLQRMVELEPTAEESHRRLMMLFATTGNRSAALVQFENCRKILATELGVNPAQETRALYLRIYDESLVIKDGTPSKNVTTTNAPLAILPDFFSSPYSQRSSAPKIVAREAELTKLDAYLQQVQSGAGTILLLSGEAGQGKTALAYEFAQRAQQKLPELVVATGNCNAQAGIGDPYLPFCEILELLTGEVEPKLLAGAISRDHALRLWQIAPLSLHTLCTVAPDLVGSLLTTTPLIQRASQFDPHANDLSAQLEAIAQRKQAAIGTAQARQEQLFSQVAKLLQQLAHHHPLLLLIDDLQWADNGSIQLLFHLARQLAGHRIMILGMVRGNEVRIGRGNDRHPLEPVINEIKRSFGEIEIDLDESEGRSLVDALLDRDPNQLDEAFRQMLYRQTEGHPLFTVELLRGMQERGDLHRDEEGRWVVGKYLDWEHLPARVEAVIAERIGRLPELLQRLLQVASIEGEFFTAEVAARVLNVGEAEMIRQLSELADRRYQLVRVRGIQRLEGQRLSFFRFSHVLFQRYLYQHSDYIERSWLHEAVGNALEHLYQSNTESLSTVAVILAFHFEESALLERASNYLFIAGERALRLSANFEAITHLQKAIELLRSLPQTDYQAKQELKIRIALAPSLSSVYGWTARQTFTNNQYTYQLAQKVGDEKQAITAMWGLITYYGPSSEYRSAIEMSEKMLELATQNKLIELQVLAHRLLCGFVMHMGNSQRGIFHAKQVLELYEVKQHQFYITRYSDDPGITVHTWSSRCFWLLGYPEQASADLRAGIIKARQSGHSFTLAFSLTGLGVYQYQYALEEMRQSLDELQLLIRKHQFSFMAWQAKAYGGWLCTQQGELMRGIQLIHEALADVDAIGGRWAKAYFLSLLADSYKQNNLPEQGLLYLDEAFKSQVKGDDQHWDAELYRLRGELLLAHDCSAISVAESNFQQALTIARQQQAKSLELRAATSLARLWQSQEKEEEAYQLLAPVYEWFTEGFDTQDLQEAKALLEELNRMNSRN